mmetsp:Transcript_40370/g.111209  ORF Transcript_40370/g.111209 Transcript_40370/m.111209 type:complete len:334 (-) Transcript_40370:1080-2081(-)
MLCGRLDGAHLHADLHVRRNGRIVLPLFQLCRESRTRVQAVPPSDSAGILRNAERREPASCLHVGVVYVQITETLDRLVAERHCLDSRSVPFATRVYLSHDDLLAPVDLQQNPVPLVVLDLPVVADLDQISSTTTKLHPPADCELHADLRVRQGTVELALCENHTGVGLVDLAVHCKLELDLRRPAERREDCPNACARRVCCTTHELHARLCVLRIGRVPYELSLDQACTDGLAILVHCRWARAPPSLPIWTERLTIFEFLGVHQRSCGGAIAVGCARRKRRSGVGGRLFRRQCQELQRSVEGWPCLHCLSGRAHREGLGGPSSGANCLMRGQ